MEAEALSDDALIRKVLTVFGQKSLEKVHGGGKKQIATVIKSGLSFKAGVDVKEQLVSCP